MEGTWFANGGDDIFGPSQRTPDLGLKISHLLTSLWRAPLSPRGGRNLVSDSCRRPVPQGVHTWIYALGL
jgi:hypothetical protein